MSWNLKVEYTKQKSVGKGREHIYFRKQECQGMVIKEYNMLERWVSSPSLDYEQDGEISS